MISVTRFASPALSCCTSSWPRRHLNRFADPIPDHHDDNADSEFIPLLPEGTNKRSFLKRPTDIKQRQRFINLKKDIVMISRSNEPERMIDKFQRYILENPKSHYISLQCLQQMSAAFAAKGDVERCREILNLTKKLLKHKKLHSHLDMNHTRIVAHYLFSLMNCSDKERGRQGVVEFYDKVKEHQQKHHPVILDGLSKVLMGFEMEDKMKELLKLAPSTKLQSPSAVLQLADTLVSEGRLEDAAELLESHSDSVDLNILNADHYALLAKIVTAVYERPGYKQISRFCREPSNSMKNFTHFPVPLPKNAVLCRNYELVLHVAAERKVHKLFRIVGGRNGLAGQLEHISCYEHVRMVQYIVQLCRYYSIPIDTPFWNYLFFSFFHCEKRGSINHCDVIELRRALNFYPLTSKMWCKIIDSVRDNQLEAVYQNLIKVGMMDDNIYSCLISRTSKDSRLYSQLLLFSEHYSVNNSKIQDD